MFTTVSARMDTQLKHEAEEVLSRLGLSHSSAINSLYSQITLRQGIPFEIALPPKRNESALTIQEIQKSIRNRAKQYGAERVYLFGSHARRTATEKSDVDLRVDKGNIRGFALGGFLDDIQQDLGYPVDIATTESLSEEFLDRIKEEEILLYER